MLPKINRIKKKKDFEIIFKKTQGSPRGFKNNFFVLKTIKNDLGLNRFGFIVSQKVSKKATVRNKIRRRLAEAVRNLAEKTEAGVDSVIIALPGIDRKDFSEIKEAVNNMLIKAGLIKK